MARGKKPKCLCGGTCGDDKIHCRGLSRSCYQSAGRDVAKGKTTWDALIAAGLALEATPRQSRRRTGIGRKIDELAAAPS